jgi:NhaA family Na+:H+ antiporter
MGQPSSNNQEQLTGILMLCAAILALIASNSPINGWYEAILETRMSIKIGDAGLDKPLLLWVNEGLMTLFFFLVGLEIKKELKVGLFADKAQLAAPLAGAIGGIVVPAAIFFMFNMGNTETLSGWAIPTATDIAFAVAAVSIFREYLPKELRLMLLAIAVIDDLAAVVLIAIFYTVSPSAIALMLAGLALVGQIILNRYNVKSLAPYLILGAFMWVAVLKSGVHATLSGVVTAMMIPYINDDEGHNLIESTEHGIKPWVNLFILPIFALANAGVSLLGLSASDWTGTVTLGICMGLFLGKPIGILIGLYLPILLRLTRLPPALTFGNLLGMSFLCGIGFTMSLFIAGLAYEDTADSFVQDRLGILMGSFLSAAVGLFLLHLNSRRTSNAKANT